MVRLASSDSIVVDVINSAEAKVRRERNPTTATSQEVSNRPHRRVVDDTQAKATPHRWLGRQPPLPSWR